MWIRFTERARRTVFFAQEEAGRLGENHVSTEHILLGIVRESDSAAMQVLEGLKVSRGRLRQDIERQVIKGEGRTDQDMQLTPRAKRVIDLAFEEARQLNESSIGTEHLLLGLIAEGEGLAARILQRLGVELEKAREETRRLKAKSQPEEKQEAKAAVLTEVGVLGELHPQESRDVIESAWTEEAMIDLAGIFRARDGVGYEELIQTGDMALLPPGTEAKLLNMGRGIGGVLVRLRSGEHTGKTAWIFPESFVAIREDDSPFPPKIDSTK